MSGEGNKVHEDARRDMSRSTERTLGDIYPTVALLAAREAHRNAMGTRVLEPCRPTGRQQNHKARLPTGRSRYPGQDGKRARSGTA